MAHSRLSYGLSSQYICYNNEQVRYAGRASATGRPNAAAGMLSDSGTAAAIGSAVASAGKGGLGEVSANGCSGTRGTQARELELVLLAAVGGSLAASGCVTVFTMPEIAAISEVLLLGLAGREELCSSQGWSLARSGPCEPQWIFLAVRCLAVRRASVRTPLDF